MVAWIDAGGFQEGTIQTTTSLTRRRNARLSDDDDFASSSSGEDVPGAAKSEVWAVAGSRVEVWTEDGRKAFGMVNMF